MQNKISTLVGLRNNLDYSKEFYKYFRRVYSTEELVFVSYNSFDGTDEWLDSLNDPNLIYLHSQDDGNFSDTFNKCAELATNSFIVFCHNDMVVAPMFLENLEKYLHKDRAVGYVTVEPPIFPSPRVGKIIRDFGDGFENFNESFFEFARQEQENMQNQTENGITFFSAMSREVFLEMGGFDNIFNPMFMEDTDLIRRIEYRKLKCFTSRDSITNHFVSKTSRFSEEYKEKTRIIENNSQRNYLRKWGSQNSNNRFNIGFIVENCNEQLLEALEPWCDQIYLDDGYKIISSRYVEKEQPNTSFLLKYRIRDKDEEKINDIIIKFDASKLNNNNFEIIKNLQNILGDTTVGEKYEIDIFEIEVNNLNNTIQDLIFISK